MQIDLGEQTIRSYRESDQFHLAQQANNRAIWLKLTDGFPHPYSEQDACNWIELATNMEPETHFAITNSDDELIGGIGLHPHSDIYRCGAEIGYWLGQDHWGQGIATRALQALTRWAFITLPLERLQAGVFSSNPASGRVLTKAGYQLEGRMHRKVIKDGKVMDLLLYATLRPNTTKRKEKS